MNNNIQTKIGADTPVARGSSVNSALGFVALNPHNLPNIKLGGKMEPVDRTNSKCGGKTYTSYKNNGKCG